MIPLLTKLAGWKLKRRMKQIEHFMQNPITTQAETLKNLLRAASATEWGIKYGYASIETIEQFQQNVPISTYEQLFPYIDRMLKGEKDVLWQGSVSWFAKSSGTSNNKSKFIPITEASLHDCHYRAGRDLIAIYLENHQKDSQIFGGKILSIGGSHEPNPYNKGTYCGDLSAVLLENLPTFYELMRTPSKKVALMANWEEKLEAMCEEVIDEDIRAIVGVPTWTMLLIQKVLEKKGILDNNLLRIWPNLEAFFHGGVSFDPYKQAFKAYFPSLISFIDIYNASEGFFGIQFASETDNMLLMLDYGIFYEFIDVHELDQDKPQVLGLKEVELHTHYAMLISTNSGLWRYLIGDTVIFSSLYPFTIQVSGRTQHYINAFGEELMIDNADKAIAAACTVTDAIVCEYTAAPVFMADKKAGRHEWLIEFYQLPNNIAIFAEVLDTKLKSLNADYEAKRQGSLALDEPLIQVVPRNTFYRWMKNRGKLGGQHKVPRLCNTRIYVESILKMMQEKK
jgi:GH3 auxin-responsive promoter